MKTAVIIDDEKNGRIALAQKLKICSPTVRVVGEAENGIEGLQLISRVNPDIVFLDIEMPKMDGFTMLKHLQLKDFHLIFTTAYDQYAIQAIKYAAFDYLLKPIDTEELQLAIDKINKISHRSNQEKLDVLTNHTNESTHPKKLAIPTVDEFVIYQIDEIIALEAKSNYTLITSINKKDLLASKTLKEFEELLPQATFVRTHNSHLINIQYVERYIKTDGGEIELRNGMKVPVSRRRKNEVMAYFDIL